MTGESELRNSSRSLRSGPTIVASHECIPIVPSHLPIHEFLGLLQCDIHVAIDRLKLACVHQLAIVPE